MPGQMHRGAILSRGIRQRQLAKTEILFGTPKCGEGKKSLPDGRQEHLSLLQAAKWHQNGNKNSRGDICMQIAVTERNIQVSECISRTWYDEWCLQCVLASALFPNLLHFYGFEVTSCTAELQLVPGCWGKGRLYWSVKLPNQRLRSRRWAETVLSWNWKEYISQSWQFFKYLGFFHISSM